MRLPPRNRSFPWVASAFLFLAVVIAGLAVFQHGKQQENIFNEKRLRELDEIQRHIQRRIEVMENLIQSIPLASLVLEDNQQAHQNVAETTVKQSLGVESPCPATGLSVKAPLLGELCSDGILNRIDTHLAQHTPVSEQFKNHIGELYDSLSVPHTKEQDPQLLLPRLQQTADKLADASLSGSSSLVTPLNAERLISPLQLALDAAKQDRRELRWSMDQTESVSERYSEWLIQLNEAIQSAEDYIVHLEQEQLIWVEVFRLLTFRRQGAATTTLGDELTWIANNEIPEQVVIEAKLKQLDNFWSLIITYLMDVENRYRYQLSTMEADLNRGRSALAEVERQLQHITALKEWKLRLNEAADANGQSYTSIAQIHAFDATKKRFDLLDSSPEFHDLLRQLGKESDWHEISQQYNFSSPTFDPAHLQGLLESIVDSGCQKWSPGDPRQCESALNNAAARIEQDTHEQTIQSSKDINKLKAEMVTWQKLIALSEAPLTKDINGEFFPTVKGLQEAVQSGGHFLITQEKDYLLSLLTLAEQVGMTENGLYALLSDDKAAATQGVKEITQSKKRESENLTATEGFNEFIRKSRRSIGLEFLCGAIRSNGTETRDWVGQGCDKQAGPFLTAFHRFDLIREKPHRATGAQLVAFRVPLVAVLDQTQYKFVQLLVADPNNRQILLAHSADTSLSDHKSWHLHQPIQLFTHLDPIFEAIALKKQNIGKKSATPEGESKPTLPLSGQKTSPGKSVRQLYESGHVDLALADTDYRVSYLPIEVFAKQASTGIYSSNLVHWPTQVSELARFGSGVRDSSVAQSYSTMGKAQTTKTTSDPYVPVEQRHTLSNTSLPTLTVKAEGGKQKLILLGAMPKQEIKSVRLSLPATWLFLLIAIPVLLVLLWPWLKLRLLGLKDSLARREIGLLLYSMFSSVSLLSVLMLVSIDYQRTLNSAGETARRIVHEMQSAYNEEIREWYRQLTMFPAAVDHYYLDQAPDEQFASMRTPLCVEFTNVTDGAQHVRLQRTPGKLSDILKRADPTNYGHTICYPNVPFPSSNPENKWRFTSPFSMFALDDNGTQVGPRLVNGTSTINVEVKVPQREYFKVARSENLWPANLPFAVEVQDYSPLFLQRLFSLSDGALTTQMAVAVHHHATPKSVSGAHWQRLQKQLTQHPKMDMRNAKVLSAGGAMHSMLAPLLPPGYLFAVVDRDNGEVLYHGDERRVLLENFFDEIGHDPSALAYLRYQRTSTWRGLLGCPVTVTYHESNFCMNSASLMEGTPLQLVVLFDLKPFRQAAFWTGLLALLSSQALLAIGFFFALMLTWAMRSSRMSLFWPQWPKQSGYVQLMLAGLAIMPFALIWVPQAAQSMSDLLPDYFNHFRAFAPLLALILWSSLLWAISYNWLGVPTRGKVNRGIKKHLRDPALIAILSLAPLIVIPLIPSIRAALQNAQGSALNISSPSVLVALGACVIAVSICITSKGPKKPKPGEEHHTITNHYAWYFSLLCLLLVLPVTYQLFNGAHSLTAELLKRYQLESYTYTLNNRDQAETMNLNRSWAEQLKFEPLRKGHQKVHLPERNPDPGTSQPRCTGEYGFQRCEYQAPLSSMTSDSSLLFKHYSGNYLLEYQFPIAHWPFSTRSGYQLFCNMLSMPNVLSQITAMMPAFALLNASVTTTSANGGPQSLCDLSPPLALEVDQIYQPFSHSLKIHQGTLALSADMMLVVMVGLVLILLGGRAIWRPVARRLFASELPQNYRLISGKTDIETILTHPAEGGEEQRRKQLNFIMLIRAQAEHHHEMQAHWQPLFQNLTDPQPLRQVDLADARIRRVSIKDGPVYVSGFESLPYNKYQRLKALEWLEQHKAKLADEAKLALCLIVEVAPLFRMIKPQNYPDISEQQYPDAEEQFRWISIFKDCTKVHCWLPDASAAAANPSAPSDFPRDVQSVLNDELEAWPELEVIRHTFSAHYQALMESAEEGNDNQSLSDLQIIDFVQSQANSFYQFRWSLCTKEERLLLYQMAMGELINTLNIEPLEHLVRRGYVRRDPVLKIANKSFQRFVLSAESSATYEEWRKEARNSIWQQVRGPLAFSLLLLLGALFYFAMESIQGLLAMLPALLGVIPMLANLFRSDRTASGE